MDKYKLEVGEIVEKEEVTVTAPKKANLLVLDFPIFRIETAFAKIEEWTKKVKVEYEKSFKYAAQPLFPSSIGTAYSITMDTKHFEVKYRDSLKGAIPYLAIGMTSDKHEWNFANEIEPLKEKLSKIENVLSQVDMKVLGAAIGSILGSVGIEEGMKRI